MNKFQRLVLILLGLIIAILSTLFLRDKFAYKIYQNTLYSYRFIHPIGSEINFISSEDGKISIGSADTIGLKFPDGETIRFQALLKPDTILPQEIIADRFEMGRNIFSYIKESFSGIPCNYVIEGDKEYLCLYIRLDPVELQKDTQIQKVLQSIKFF